MALLRFSTVLPIGWFVHGSPTCPASVRIALIKCSYRFSTYLLQELEVPMCMTGLTFGGGTEHRRYVIVSLNISTLCEIQITPIKKEINADFGTIHSKSG
jgi:hypothetical protein